MDLTSPFNFDLAGLQLVYTPQGIVFAEKFQKGYKILANNNFENQEMTNVLALGNKPTYQIVCANGNTLLLGADCKVYTKDGWVDVSELKAKDLILHRIVVDNQNKSKGSLPINYNQKLKTSAMPIYAPKKNSEEFSEWIGIFLACGSIDQNSGRISVVHGSEEIIKRYSDLTEKLFRLRPVKTQDKREDRKPEYYFISQNIVNFIKDNLGILSHMKKIPSFLLEGSNEEHLSLLKGLSASSDIEGIYLTFYEGPSKNIADCISLILRNNGYVVYEKRLDYRKSDNDRKSYYVVSIMGAHEKAPKDITYFSEQKEFVNKPLNVLVDIGDKLKEVKIRSFDKGYSAYKKMIKECRTICSWQTAQNLGIDMSQVEHFYDEVNSIVLIKNPLKQVSIKVLYPDGFLVNNIVLGGRY